MLKRKKKLLNTIIGIGTASLVGAAIIEQLHLPAEKRTWHGIILGIPYDFRMPTPEKIRDTFWNEETAQIFVPQAFGLGWSINFYPLVHPKPANE